MVHKREGTTSQRQERLEIAGLAQPLSPDHTPSQSTTTDYESIRSRRAENQCEEELAGLQDRNVSDSFASSVAILDSVHEEFTSIPVMETTKRGCPRRKLTAAPEDEPYEPAPMLSVSVVDPVEPTCGSTSAMGLQELHQLKESLWKQSTCGSEYKPSFMGKTSFMDMASFRGARGRPSAMRPSSACGTQLPRESMAILIDAVRGSALNGNDKCRFLFDLFDVDQRQVLSKDGVLSFLETTFMMNNVQFFGALDFEQVVEKIFAANAHKDTMTYAEFVRIFGPMLTSSVNGRPSTAVMTPTNGAMTPSPLTQPPKHGSCSRWRKWYRKHDCEIFWIGLYTILMVAAFGLKFSQFSYDPAVGHAARIAKGFAQIIMVNTMFVLLPMCRNFVTWLREISWIAARLPIDQHIEFHKICGVVMLLASVGHTVGWVCIVYFARTVSAETWSQSQFNRLYYVREEPLEQLLCRTPIWTGVVMLLLALIATPLAHPRIRRGKFNAFWFAHLLFLPFLILIMVHGLAQWVNVPQAYWWIFLPLTLYFVEKRYRMGNAFGGKSSILRVHVSQDTVALFMKKPRSFGKGRVFRPGMYLFLNVPVLSRFEWHPFTISSAPEDNFLSVHIRKAGDWTSALYELLSKMENKSVQGQWSDPNHVENAILHDELVSPYPTVYIDGPVGAPSQDYHRHRVLVFVGAGIGVTPFASILRSIVHQWESYRCPCCGKVSFPKNFRIQKIYFYWVTREQEALTWFSDTMNQLSAMDRENRLEIHNFFTPLKRDSVVAPLRALQTFIHDTEGQDIISGLETKQMTHFGRPNWNNELTRIARNHQPTSCDTLENEAMSSEEIGVFYCGPKKLQKDLHDECLAVTSRMKQERFPVEFDFHSENF